jgi:phosphatidylinositol glycan class N
VYEDVSAVTTGWQANVVPVESVLSTAPCAIGIGSPDVVSPFEASGANQRLVTFPGHWEDFSGAGNVSKLDEWVVDKLPAALAHCADQPQGTVILLHFVGVDTAGHASRPHSRAYRDAVRFVDTLIPLVERIVREVTGDDRTAYIFTSDHGMGARGSHGDGSPENTECPFAAWGDGVRHSLTQLSMAQADVAPLLAALAGVRIPSNSVGVLPPQVLANHSYERQALLANAEQLAQLMRGVDAARHRRALLPLLHRPFPALVDGTIDRQLAVLRADVAAVHVDHGEDEVLLSSVRALQDLSVAGIVYYQTYDAALLLTACAGGYVGFAIVAAVAAASYRTVRLGCTGTAAAAVALPLAFAQAATGAELHTLMYPAWTGFWWGCVWHLARSDPVAARASPLSQVVHLVAKAGAAPVRSWVPAAAGLVGLELAVAGFFDRSLYAALLVLASALLVPGTGRSSAAVRLLLLLLAPFLLLPVDVGKWPSTVGLGGLTASAALTFARAWAVTGPPPTTAELAVTAGPAVAAASVVASEWFYLTRELAVPGPLRLCNVALLVVPLVALVRWVPRSHRVHAPVTAYSLLATQFVLLSVAYEPLFLTLLLSLLVVWTRSSPRTPSASLSLPAVCMYLLLTYVAFFGTGNIASLSSFDLASTYRVVTVFSPFTMAGLLVYKILIPLTAVACTFRTVVVASSTAPPHLHFFLAIAIADLMALQFLFLVRTDGSWLDIGISISHFVLQNLQVFFHLLMLLVSHALLPNAAAVGSSSGRPKRS